jgi:N-ethylmaleimide reductase
MTTTTSCKNLLSSLSMGSLTLRNRIVMAPLTRSRAGTERLPNAMMAQYYAQRASAGLIISEATSVSVHGKRWWMQFIKRTV